jgi:hypothetical protein
MQTKNFNPDTPPLDSPTPTDHTLAARQQAAFVFLKQCVARFSSHHPRTIKAQEAFTALSKEVLQRHRAQKLTLLDFPLKTVEREPHRAERQSA